MAKPHKPKFSLSPVEFREQSIAGRGVFAKKPFKPGDVITPYAPKQRRLDVDDPEAIAAAETKLTLRSEKWTVILPDTSVPGGWLCNHSCNPNAAIFSDREGRIQCMRAIAPGEEVTIFYGWGTQNEPERDPCRCGAPRCRGFINFDLSDADARLVDEDSEAGNAIRERFAEYEEFLYSIGQEQVIETIARTLAEMRAKAR
ncbi:MAG TPA: SET domain-containing protein-lysine N-methyltransferase [Polyangiaceae bacterium]|jgi:SET domain-containing protein|nr:SET domain-containing protein-lysine N-methyltransferase [Polyangiaceae bacterium]